MNPVPGTWFGGLSESAGMLVEHPKEQVEQRRAGIPLE